MSLNAKYWIAGIVGLLLLGATGSSSRAGDKCCPPPFVHCTEGPPCIVFKHVCPKPVCDPCNLEHWGYYPTCWRRWPGNWANCPHRSPPWIYNGTDYQIAENAPNAPNALPQMMLPPGVGPGMTEPPMPPTQPKVKPDQEEAPSPRQAPNLEQGGQQKFQGASPYSMKRPQLRLYTSPQGN